MENKRMEIDHEKTLAYWQNHQVKCTCAYCENYAEAFRMNYPHTSELLETFSVAVEHPLETMPFQYDQEKKEIDYMAFYAIKGTLREKMIPMEHEGLQIQFVGSKEGENLCPKPEMEEPYFLIWLDQVRLPWVLEKEPEE